MIGRRVMADEDGWLTQPFEPGDFGRADPKRFKDGTPCPEEWADKRMSYWQVMAPNGHAGCLDPKVHTVTEHEDGSITVAPSIVINEWRDGTPREVYHGWLERGVWRSCS